MIKRIFVLMLALLMLLVPVAAEESPIQIRDADEA